VDLWSVYILGFTEDLERAKASLKDYKLEVYRFSHPLPKPSKREEKKT
jgi:hypothetical protein